MIEALTVFDAYICLDRKNLSIRYAQLKEPFNFISIEFLKDLDLFFQKLFGNDVYPLLLEFEYDSKCYLVSQKIYENDIIFSIQNIDTIKNILLAKKEVLFDGLTKCYLKKEIETFIEQALENFVRYKKEKFSVIMFDIDLFKKVNDTFGHLAGDFILKELASLVKKSLRKVDICGRFGGEEFLILLPNTKATGALKLATKLNKLVREHLFQYENKTIPIAISLGITTVSYSDSYHSLVQRCDEALYKAKENGRDRVEYQ